MIEPYIYLNGQCAQAMLFYEKVFYASDVHMEMDPNDPNKHNVLFGSLIIDKTKVNFSDVVGELKRGNQVALQIQFKETDALERCYHLLKEGGTLKLPLKKGNSTLYAVIEDRYHVTWQLVCKQGTQW